MVHEASTRSIRLIEVKRQTAGFFQTEHGACVNVMAMGGKMRLTSSSVWFCQDEMFCPCDFVAKLSLITEK